MLQPDHAGRARVPARALRQRRTTVDGGREPTDDPARLVVRTRYLGVPRLTFGVGIVVLAIGISVFGRLEANFAEEL